VGDIVLIELEGLLPHEETIPEHLHRLILQLDGDGALWVPVVVDRETRVVLDGAHRVAALRKLGCRLVCAYLVDYRNPAIKIQRWVRTISKPFDARKAAEMAEELDLKLTPTRSRTVCDGDGPVLRLEDGGSYALAPQRGSADAFDVLRRFEQRLKEEGFEVEFETEREAEERLMRGGASASLYPPKIGKGQVVDAARSERVLPCKATRHMVPGLPVGVDVPLRLLRDPALSLEEANRRVSAMLSLRRFEKLPHGTVWRGWRYGEDIYIFR